MTKIKTGMQRLYLIFVFIFLYLPIIYLAIYSFNDGATMNHWHGWTLDHYRELVSDARLQLIVLQTLLVALLSALIATVIGTLGAMSLYYLRPQVRQWVLSLNNLLLVMPDVMIGASFLLLFAQLFKIPLGFGTVLVSHIAFNVPIVVLMVLPRLYQMNPSLVTAGMDLGASWPQIMTRIILPVIQPGIVAGFLMAFTYSLDDFAVTFFVTGQGFSTLSVEIYSRARQGISLEINALSTVLFGIVLTFVLIYYWLEMRALDRTKY